MVIKLLMKPVDLLIGWLARPRPPASRLLGELARCAAGDRPAALDVIELQNGGMIRPEGWGREVPTDAGRVSLARAKTAVAAASARAAARQVARA